jgi:Mg2+ and Co2+ transporter CorA
MGVVKKLLGKDAVSSVDKTLGLFDKIIKGLESCVELCGIELKECDEKIQKEEQKKTEVTAALTRAKKAQIKLQDIIS